MHRVTITADDVVYREGETSGYAYLLLSGGIAMERGGTALPAATGAVIGLSALAGVSYGATARATQQSELLAFSRRELRGLIRSDPDRALQIIDGIIGLVGKMNLLERHPVG